VGHCGVPGGLYSSDQHTTNYWLLIPAGAGAFLGTWVGMRLRKNKQS